MAFVCLLNEQVDDISVGVLERIYDVDVGFPNERFVSAVSVIKKARFIYRRRVTDPLFSWNISGALNWNCLMPCRHSYTTLSYTTETNINTD